MAAKGDAFDAGFWFLILLLLLMLLLIFALAFGFDFRFAFRFAFGFWLLTFRPPPCFIWGEPNQAALSPDLVGVR